MKEPIWLDQRDVLAIHDRLLAEHGGPAGIRDHGLFESALARPQQQHAYTSPTIVELAALYTAGIVRNHPFVDGSKRTGFVLGVLFLELNGYRFIGPEEDATQAVLALAAGQMNEKAFGVWMKANIRPVGKPSG